MTRNTPFTVQIEHDQIDTTSYRLEVNGAVQGTTPVNPAGVQFPFPTGLVPGTYSFVAVAVGPAGETASDPVELVVVPGFPGKPRLIILVG